MSEELIKRLRAHSSWLRDNCEWEAGDSCDDCRSAALLTEARHELERLTANTEPRSRLLTAATRMLEVRGDQEDPGVRVSARDLVEVLATRLG